MTVKMNEHYQQEKTCKGPCGRTLPRDQFVLKTSRNDQRHPYCHDCWPEFHKQRLARLVEDRKRIREQWENGEPVDRERQIYLDCSRIVAWIDSLPRSEDDGEREIAEWLGTSMRQLFRLRNEPGITMSLDHFDRMLVNAGVPWVMNELFPELFEFDEDGNPHPAVREWRRMKSARGQEAAA